MPQQLATLTAEPGYSVRARVKVERGSVWYDLTHLLDPGSGGLDFLEGVTISESTESPVATAQVLLLREVNGASISPLMVGAAANTPGSGFNPLLKEARRFTVEAAVMPLGMEPTASDWVEVFRGRIDEIDVGGEGVSFSGRDYGYGLLQDTFIRTEREYGSNTVNVDVASVMQDILADNGRSALPLYVPVPAGWALGKYVQKGEPVADALQALARQLGWEVRWKWRSTGAGTGEWRLCLWSPDRSATTPVWTYGPGHYARLEEVRTSLEDVRNDFEGIFSDATDLDEAGSRKRKKGVDSDAASIAAFDRRFCRFAEAATSNIDSAAEMATLLSRAKADLKDVPLGVSFEVLFHPGLQLGDLVRLEANQVHFSAEQTAAVQALTHTFSAGVATTKLVLRGKPSLGRRTWLDMEQRPGLAPASPFTGPEAPSNLTTAETVQGFRLRFDPPTSGPKAATYELHASTTGGFTPSSATRRASSDATEFTVNDLTPGTPHYVQVVPRDAQGNRGTPSAERMLTPRYISPSLTVPRMTWGALPLNGDNEQSSDSSRPPDAWRLNAGATWGSHAQLTADVLSGRAAVFFPISPTPVTLSAQPFTVREGEAWVLSAFYKQSLASTSSGVLAFSYLDANLSAISAVSITLGTSAPANTWTRAARKVTIPAGARFGEVSYSRLSGYGGTLTVDSVDALRTVAWGAWQSVAYLNGWTDANLAVYGAVRFRMTDLGEVEFRGEAKASTPAPASNSIIFTLPATSGCRPTDFTRVFTAATAAGAFVRFSVEPTGNVRVSTINAGDTFNLAGIRYFVD